MIIIQNMFVKKYDIQFNEEHITEIPMLKY